MPHRSLLSLLILSCLAGTAHAKPPSHAEVLLPPRRRPWQPPRSPPTKSATRTPSAATSSGWACWPDRSGSPSTARRPRRPAGRKLRAAVGGPGQTAFDVPDIDSITLPARSSRSLLCHWQTPIVYYSASNNTGSTQNFTLRAQPVYRIESEVLDEPGLLNPGTGLPYGGEMELPLTAIYKAGSRDPGEYEFEVITGARMCIGSLVSLSSLVSTHGLTPAQARRFFSRPITIHLGISGQAQLVDDAQIYFGTRFVGD
ncbi:hypothetical protein [Arenimonas daejeonensis]|uniref:hypothetical protein n=1 Tax=Arenimonas daejeonensis TaxID=370777 RepID=UPI00131561BE|nr:hypothetical protein [Arenimonas daejeonensis]